VERRSTYALLHNDDPTIHMDERMYQEHILEDSFATLNKGSYQSFHAAERQIKVSLLSQ
jgi:hypothetical protein